MKTDETTVSVSGAITYYQTGASVAGVTVLLTGDALDSTTTDAAGAYIFDGLDLNGHYVITPGKTTDSPTAKGVDAADQALITQHILQIPPEILATPYQLLAADVDGSGQIDSADQIQIQRLIMGRALHYLAGLWRFIPTAFVFPDPLAPWTAPQEIVFESLQGAVTNANFTGIKLGDVNASWTP